MKLTVNIRRVYLKIFFTVENYANIKEFKGVILETECRPDFENLFNQNSKIILVFRSKCPNFDKQHQVSKN